MSSPTIHRKPWSRTFALAWEQLVVSASICTLAFAIDVVLSLMAWLGSGNDTEIGSTGAFGALLIAGSTSVVRQNVLGELAMDFDPRLRRLPIRTLPLAVTVFGVRSLCMFTLALAVCLLHYALFREWPGATGIVLLLMGYFILQTVVWTRNALTGIDYLVPIGLFASIVSVLLYTNPLTRVERSQFEHDLTNFLGSPLLLLAVWIACFLVSLIGIALIRRDARWGLPKPAEIRDALAGVFAAPDRPFRSPLAAQIWFERQRCGRLFGMLWLAVVVVLVTLLPLLYGDTGDAITYWLPFLAMFLVAPVAGAVAISVGAGPLFSRPIPTRHMALAKLVSLLQGMLGTVALAGIVSLLLRIYADSETWAIMMAAYDAGEIDLRGLSAWVIGPIVLTAWLAWFLAFFRTVAMIKVIAGSAILIVLIGVIYDNPTQQGHLFWIPVALLILVPLLEYWRCFKRGLLPARALEIAAAVVAVSIVFVTLYSSAVQFDASLAWLGFAAGGMLVMPGATLTLHLYRLRHR